MTDLSAAGCSSQPQTILRPAVLRAPIVFAGAPQPVFLTRRNVRYTPISAAFLVMMVLGQADRERLRDRNIWGVSLPAIVAVIAAASGEASDAMVPDIIVASIALSAPIVLNKDPPVTTRNQQVTAAGRLKDAALLSRM